MRKFNLQRLKSIMDIWVEETKDYYRTQLNNKIPVDKLLKESLNKDEFLILKNLVVAEFPQHKDKITKCHLLF